MHKVIWVILAVVAVIALWVLLQPKPEDEKLEKNFQVLYKKDISSSDFTTGTGFPLGAYKSAQATGTADHGQESASEVHHVAKEDPGYSDGKRESGSVGVIIGRVIAEDTGKGLEWVSVSMINKDGNTPFYDVSTDKDGYFRAWVSQVGNYNVKVGLKSGSMEVQKARKYDAEKYVDDSDLIDKYQLVTIPPNGGEVRLPDVVVAVGGTVKVRVFKADGSLMELEKVLITRAYVVYKGARWYGSSILCEGEKWYRDAPPIWSNVACRQADGSYLIKGVPQVDDLDVSVQLYGYMWPKVSGIKVKKKETTSVDVMVRTDDPTGVMGVITDTETGEPIKAASIDIKEINNDKKPWEWVSGLAIADGSGKYIISGVKPGFYKMFVMARKYDAAEKSKPIEIKKGETTTINIYLHRESGESKIREE